VMRLPGRGKKRVTNDVALLDIVPTVLEAVSAPSKATRPELDGQSLLLPALTPEKAPTERPLFCSVISQNVQQGEFLRRSVKAGRFKLMKELRGVNERALYDVKRDPKEKTPVPLEGEALRTADELDAAMSAQFTGNLRDANLND
jgi:arylsulfatase A-like enzyme